MERGTAFQCVLHVLQKMGECNKIDGVEGAQFNYVSSNRKKETERGYI